MASSDNSMRGACWNNEISRASLQFLNCAGVGDAWFVSATGSDSANGKTWDAAFLTIAYAVSKCAAGDTIFIKGTAFDEAVTCSKAGVSFIGAGTNPHETSWTAPTVAGSACLTLSAAECYVENIRFRPVVYTTSGVPSGIRLSGANYTTIRNCLFMGRAGSYAAIYSPVCDSDVVKIENCEFLYMNTATYGAGILGVEAGGYSYSDWRILNCRFASCVTDININGRNCLLKGNVHPIGGITAADAVSAAVTTLAIDLSGTSSGCNTVTGCSLAGAYTSTLYVGGAAGDNWAGNYGAITTTYCPNGVTVPTKPA